MEQVLKGTDIKFKVDVSGGEFDINRDSLEIEIYKGSSEFVRRFTKDDLIYSEDDGVFLLCIETKDLEPGRYDAVVYTHVEDGDFPDGERTEVNRITLLTVKKV